MKCTPRRERLQGTGDLPPGGSGQGRSLLDTGPDPIRTGRGSLHRRYPETGKGTQETVSATVREIEGGKAVKIRGSPIIPIGRNQIPVVVVIPLIGVRTGYTPSIKALGENNPP
jgi:hypothetical protein